MFSNIHPADKVIIVEPIEPACVIMKAKAKAKANAKARVSRLNKPTKFDTSGMENELSLDTSIIQREKKNVI